ncbi:MAG: magnesium transporter [Clostridia bacterium]|nr:magnesium transporter [Clostridia bacterium]MBQ7788144.1 magnesium transporter [Clostridia bacterium]
MEEIKEIINTIDELLETHNYSGIKNLLKDFEPADLSLVLEEFPKKIGTLFRLLPKDLAAECFVEMESDNQERLLSSFTDKELKEVMDEIYIDDTVDIIEEMPANVVKRILNNSDPETRKVINEILKYPDDSAGSLMTTEYVSLDADITVEDALKRIRRTGVDKETIYTCYVTKPDRTLLGYVTAKKLLLSSEDMIIADIMETSVIFVHTHEDKEVVAKEMSKYDLLALPVVDAEERLVGIITVDDAIDVIEEEATEDIEKMAAIIPSDKPYLNTNPFEIWKNRMPWLILLMLSATFTSQIITSFEEKLATCLVLNAFIPMIMGSGGNAGGQTSVTIIRGLALEEITMGDIFKILFKELRVSLLCGITLGAATFVKMMLIDRLLLGNLAVDVKIALVVSFTLLVTIIVAKLVGCMLPVLAKRLGFDPAVMASPFITTIVDVLSLLIYFGISTAFVLNI